MDLDRVVEALFAEANQVAGMRGVLQFRFAPDHVVSVRVADTVTVNGAGTSAPDIVIDVSADDFIGVATGRCDVEQLFATGRVRIEGKMGLATLLPQVIGRALYGGQVDNVDQTGPDEQRYPAPARYSEVITAAQPALETIERRDCADLPSSLFYRQYVLKCRPVIIANAVENWPLFHMSREESLACFEGLQGITRSGDYVTKTFSKNRDFSAESVAGFIRKVQRPHADDGGELPPYMGNNIVPETLQALINWPAYFHQDQYIAPRMWIGPKGTITPLHRDDSDNLFAQLWGEKAFILAAPHERSRLYTWSTAREGGLEASDVDAEAPDYEKHPLALPVHFLKAQVGAGDMLFIPDGWFHHVRSLSLSLSVNFWTTSVRQPGEH